MANKEHLPKLAYYMEQGSHGTDDDPNNPLSRAVNCLFEDGQRFTRIALCFFGDLNGSLSRSAPLRWLGAFSFSSKRRVIFSQGLPFLLLEFSTFKENRGNRYTMTPPLRLTMSPSIQIAPGILRLTNRKLIYPVDEKDGACGHAP
jgi:hypothetical protein